MNEAQRYSQDFNDKLMDPVWNGMGPWLIAVGRDYDIMMTYFIFILVHSRFIYYIHPKAWLGG